MPEEHLPYYTDKVPISQQYRYRYLVSAEGNDVPTGEASSCLESGRCCMGRACDARRAKPFVYVMGLQG
jgi:hypothetical protein